MVPNTEIEPSHPEAFLPDTATQEFSQTYTDRVGSDWLYTPSSAPRATVGLRNRNQHQEGGVRGNPGILAELPTHQVAWVIA